MFVLKLRRRVYSLPVSSRCEGVNAVCPQGEQSHKLCIGESSFLWISPAARSVGKCVMKLDPLSKDRS